MLEITSLNYKNICLVHVSWMRDRQSCVPDKLNLSSVY